MPHIPFPDVSVQLRQRPWRCVLDPNLALSPFGAEFARRLMLHAEVWLGTEFLKILDSAWVYEREPELLAWPAPDPAGAGLLRHTMRAWTELRDEASLGGSPLHWIGDVPRESSLPSGVQEDVVTRWKGAARSLDARMPWASEAGGPLVATMRDTPALGAVLPAAILALHADTPQGSPMLCKHLACWGIACSRLVDADELVVMERDIVRRVLVQAGLAEFLWGGMDLAVLHVHAAGVGRRRCKAEALGEDGDDEQWLAEPSEGPTAPWGGAQVFWYDVRPERFHAG